MKSDTRPSEAAYNWHWLTIREFAREMGRSERQVLNWTQDGTLASFGFPIYSINRGRFHSRFFILMKP